MWSHYPALFYSLSFLIGIEAKLHFSYLLFIPLIPLFLPLFSAPRALYIRMALSLGLLLSGYFYAQAPLSISEENWGQARIKIDQLQTKKTHFGMQWIYRGTLVTFIPDNAEAESLHNLPFQLTLPHKAGFERPTADQQYWIHARLLSSHTPFFSLKIRPTEPWIPIKNTWSIAESRFQWKENIKKLLKEKFHSRDSMSFLVGIATGDFEDPLLNFELGRFGLQHIMAISGFHFAIIATFLFFLLRFVFAEKVATIGLLSLLAGYFLLLGASPSIMRAWLMITIALVGILCHRSSTSLNSLGVAILIILIYDPLALRKPGFQFSFLTTAAILLFTPIVDLFLKIIFKKRALGDVLSMDAWNQHGYLLVTLIRQAFSLAFAVNLVALPLTLFYFHKFPLMSLLYNLFFPFLVSLSMLFLIFGLFLELSFPSIAAFIHTFNDYYTQFVLNFTHAIPRSLDFTLRVYNVDLSFLILYFVMLFSLGFYLKHRLDKQNEEWTFI